jgi:hypothetical protein
MSPQLKIVLFLVTSIFYGLDHGLWVRKWKNNFELGATSSYHGVADESEIPTTPVITPLNRFFDQKF